MKFIDKVKPFFTDFLFQSTVFYIAMISPIGVLPYYIAGSAGTNSILWHELYYLNKYFSLSRLLETFGGIFLWMPLYSIVLSAPLSIANIYILRVNTYKLGDDDYFAMKLLFMLIAGSLLVPYIFVVAQGNYHEVLYSAFPAILTSILYLLFVVYKQYK
jgi:hypothetical protein